VKVLGHRLLNRMRSRSRREVELSHSTKGDEIVAGSGGGAAEDEMGFGLVGCWGSGRNPGTAGTSRSNP
jgi:hypothetical protein